jgi:hypothetical protein
VFAVRRERLDVAKSVLVDARVKPVIILNASLVGTGVQNEPFTRSERFLIAHELGHLLLLQSGAGNPSGRAEYWKVERLCDAFARRLLVPERAATQIVEGAKPTPTDRLRATLAMVESCRVPWSVAALRVADVNEDTVFFRLVQESAGGFKIVVSTFPNQQGIGQRIKPGTFLHETVRQRWGIRKLHEIDGQRLAGIAGIETVRSGATYAVSGSICLAAMPS